MLFVSTNINKMALQLVKLELFKFSNFKGAIRLNEQIINKDDNFTHDQILTGIQDVMVQP